MRKLICLAVTLSGMGFHLGSASGADPPWSPVIIATGTYRDQIRATPIEMRPYRPLHFYGNAVRRRHHRGAFLPPPRDLSRSVVFGFGTRPN